MYFSVSYYSFPPATLQKEKRKKEGAMGFLFLHISTANQCQGRERVGISNPPPAQSAMWAGYRGGFLSRKEFQAGDGRGRNPHKDVDCEILLWRKAGKGVPAQKKKHKWTCILRMYAGTK